MEGAIGGLQTQFLAQYHERISFRVEDRLGVFAFVDRLIDTRAKSGYVRERENGAAYPVIALRVRSDPQYECLVLVSEIMPRCGLGRDYLRTPSLQIPQVSESGDVASRPADVRDGETERLSSRSVEARDGKVSVKDDDRNIDRVEDLAAVEGNRVRCRGIAGAPAGCRPGRYLRNLIASLSVCHISGVQLARALQYRVRNGWKNLTQCEQQRLRSRHVVRCRISGEQLTFKDPGLVRSNSIA